MPTALVLGGAACVWSDVEAAVDLGEFHGVVGCNDIGSVWPGVMDAWVSLHAQKFRHWRAKRVAQGLPAHKRILGHVNALSQERGLPDCITAYVDHAFPGELHSGSSGLFALKVALIDLGFDKAVLCGVPMSASEAHFFHAADWAGATAHQKGWLEVLPEIKARARSMSGWTADLLGPPSADWLT